MTSFLSLPKEPVYVESERLVLRPLYLHDVYDVFEYASNPNVTRYNDCDPHICIEESREFIKTTQNLNADNALCFLGIVLKNKRKVIGTVGLFKRTDLSRFTLELGYSLSEAWWGYGYATEAVQSLINYAFSTIPNLKRIEATCLTPNVASQKVMEKVGMHREGILRDYYFKNDHFYNSYQYSILREEWDL